MYFELRMKDQIEERSSQLVHNLSSCEKRACGISGLISALMHQCTLKRTHCSKKTVKKRRIEAGELTCIPL